VLNSVFEGNYHHTSFAEGSNATVGSSTFINAIAEAYECYGSSNPLLDGVTIEGQDGDGIHIRNASRPRMVGGTPVSNLNVDSKDNASYVIALAKITVEVIDDNGKSLVDANVTVSGASGMVFTHGSTDDKGRLEGAMMSLYTVSSAGGHDRENPHKVLVEWRGHVQSFTVDPRDLDNDRVLIVELALSPPEPAGSDLFSLSMLVITVIIVIGALVWWSLRRNKG
jgi:hypothetical protein